MPEAFPNGRPGRKWSDSVDALGRAIITSLVCLIPLAFLKETHYIFQIKTTCLQIGGWALALTIILRFSLKERKAWLENLHPWSLLLLAWALWMTFKSWNSISPIISQREATRLVWLPLIPLGIQLFFQNEQQKKKLLGAVIVTALAATFFATAIRIEAFRNLLQKPGGWSLDLFSLPLFPWALKPFFFPPELDQLFQSKLTQATTDSESILALNSNSFFPGKDDAGTFGNKNFLAGYLNLTLPLLIWKGLQLLKKIQSNQSIKTITYLSLILLGISLQLFHIASIGNRASWLGLLGAMGASTIFLFLSKGSAVTKKLIPWSILPFALILTIYLTQPQRVSSILNPFQGSNELRLLTWSSWLNGFNNDNSWEGFSSKAWRWGSGWGNHTFRVAYPRYRNDRIFKIENNLHSTETTHAHNHPLNTLGELGVMGLTLELLLFLIPLWMTILFIKKNKKDALLPCLLALALLTQSIQAFFSVASRYTGVAFQTWLTLGLLVAFLPKPRHNSPPQTFRLKYLAIALPFLAMLVMPDPRWPIEWLQSQHFHAKAQSLQAKAKLHHQKAHELERVLSQNKKEQTSKRDHTLTKEISYHRQSLSTLAPLAEKYYELAINRDPAQIESPYLCAVMQIQFGNQHLKYRQIKPALQLFEESLEKLSYVRARAPHFIQLDYWKALAFKGKALAASHLGDSVKMNAALENALVHLQDYSKLDPFFPESHLEAYYIYHRLGRHASASRELKKVLFNTLHYGSDLFPKDPRYDIIRVSQLLHDRLEEQESTEIKMILKLLHHFQSSTCLLPHIPKTGRHVKNSLHLLRDPHGH